MTRSDDDTWNITESVGTTAFGAAEWRAREVQHEHPLFTDSYAQLFLDAARARGWSAQFDDKTIAQVQATDPELMRRVLAIWSYVGARTKWFDDYFAMTSADVDQAVILAAGLDARAWRLPWTPNSTVYELDQPPVLAFKAETLRSHHAESATRYVAVPIDLRQDWPKALCEAGFNPGQPTAWSAEGLLVYLPADAQDLLFDRIHALSAKGSRIAVDALSAAFFSPENQARLKAHFDQVRDALAEEGGDAPSVADLWFDEKRSDVATWLREHGWQVDAVDVHDLMAHYHREVSEEDGAAIPQCDFISGRLEADG